jgi:hypothetical protein
MDRAEKLPALLKMSRSEPSKVLVGIGRMATNTFG